MKKHFTLIALALVCIASVSVAAPAKSPAKSSKLASKEVKGVHPYDVTENKRSIVSKEDANWSLYLHGGFNVFDGDFASEKKHSVSAPTIGLGADYKFNPTWGMGLDYTFRQVGVAGDTKAADNAAKLLKGFQHQAMVYLNFDIFNIFFPKAVTKLFALNVFGGGGAMFWRNAIQYPTGERTNLYDNKGNLIVDKEGKPIKVWVDEYNKYHTANQEPDKMDKYDAVGALAAGLSFDFNISRDFALGLRALYTYYVSDEVDGRLLSNNNDGVFDTELLLRWKIQAEKKSHVNNYVNKEMLSLAARGKRGLGGVEDEVKKDTVVIFHRDTIERITRDTVEIFHKDTIVMAVARGGDTTNIYNSSITYITNPESEKENYFYVYFDPDRYNLSDEALVIIQQVADRMEKEPNLYAAVIGYCDNVGSAEYNKRLGQNRSQNVYEELLFEHGVSADRMFAISKGIVVGKRSSSQYAPNRRVEIRLVDRTFFNELRAQYREDIELQKAFVKTRNANK